uniref:Uncharacterized protein n=1 Tax=Panagrolaimus sp. ES5 TaxID=591445 RepID=A0AC34GBH7_9BILA
MNDFDGANVQFSSDGNTQQAGFDMHYNIIDCKCANTTFVVPCTGGTLFPTPADHLYCSNLKCNYTLVKDSSCPYDHFTVKLNLKMRDSSDYINVYLNGQLNEKLTSINSNRKVYSFNSNPLFEFSSGGNGNGLTDFENSWSMDVNYGDPPNKLLTRNLTTSNPTYAVWKHAGSVFVFTKVQWKFIKLWLI